MNNYKKLAQLMAKSRRIMLERNGDYVYIVSDWMGVKVLAQYYEMFFSPVNPRYARLQQGERVRSEQKQPPEETSSSAQHIFKGACSEGKTAVVTAFLQEHRDVLARIIQSSEGIVEMQECAYQALKVFDGKWMASSKNKTVVFEGDAMSELTVCVCPINYCLTDFEFFQEVLNHEK